MLRPLLSSFSNLDFVRSGIRRMPSSSPVHCEEHSDVAISDMSSFRTLNYKAV
jgi:hypothetical protein